MAIEVTVYAPQGGWAVVNGFNQLWAFYVRGFKPTQHCQQCFKGMPSRHLGRDSSKVGVTFVFDECRDFRQVYICGVAAGPKVLRRERNLHLPMVDAAGEGFEVETYNGFRWVARNARLLAIPEPRPELAHLGVDYYRCKNFRFGVEYYGYPGLS